MGKLLLYMDVEKCTGSSEGGEATRHKAPKIRASGYYDATFLLVICSAPFHELLPLYAVCTRYLYIQHLAVVVFVAIGPPLVFSLHERVPCQAVRFHGRIDTHKVCFYLSAEKRGDAYAAGGSRKKHAGYDSGSVFFVQNLPDRGGGTDEELRSPRWM